MIPCQEPPAPSSPMKGAPGKMTKNYKVPSWKLLKNRVRPEIKRFAKKLRKNQTRYENLFWEQVRARKFHKLKFRRQHIARGYILDFYCPEKRLAIEIDGLGHDARKDAVRDLRLLRNCRISTLRFSNGDVEKRMPQVLETIAFRLGINGFPRNPQAQQQQEIYKPIKKDCDDESCGNSGNVENRPVCTKQVYSCMEVAEDTVKVFSHVGIVAKAQHCEVCHLVHVEEVTPCST